MAVWKNFSFVTHGMISWIDHLKIDEMGANYDGDDGEKWVSGSRDTRAHYPTQL